MKKLILHPAFLILIVFGCSTKYEEPKRIDHVQRVFMHHAGEYSLLVRNPDTGVMKTRTFEAGDVTLIADVGADEEMWAEFVRAKDGCTGKNKLFIHIKASSDIEGAGWERSSGKTTEKGTTQVVQ